MKHLLTYVLALLLAVPALADDPKLSGTVIGTSPSVDYSNSQSTTTVNLPSAAFDGDQNTFYASYVRTGAYVGLDLGQPYIITKVGCAPRNDGNGPGRVQLALFEGANSPDFSDAFPLYINKEKGTIGTTKRYDVSCSLGFRYVRYVGPADVRCNVAEVEFYGHPGTGDSTSMNIAGGLPLVVIKTVSGTDPTDKVNERPCTVKIIDTEGHILADSATVRLRGNASKDFPKKPYRVKFKTKHRVLGSPAKAKKWTLINNYGDKTLMRNMIAFRTSEMLEMPYTPFCTPVNVIMNGDFKGCYQLCDQVEIHKDRIEIDEMTPRDNTGDALTGGYFIEIDAYAYNEESGHYFYSNRGNPVTIKSPSDSIVNVQYNYIKNIFNQMESAVYNRSGWRNLLDENTFLRHFLVGELSGNTDTYWSVFMYKNRNENKLYTGPVWDFDLAYDNDNRTYPVNNLSNYVYASKGSVAGDMRSFVNNIAVYDTEAKAELKRIWSIARDKGLTAEYLCSYVDSVAEVLDEAQQLNFTRWNILNSGVHMNPQVSGSYRGEVNVVKNYINRRITWMDSKVGYAPGTYIPDALDNISISDAGPLRIYNLQGLLIFQGEEMPRLAEGFYILVRGSHSEKIYVHGQMGN